MLARTILVSETQTTYPPMSTPNFPTPCDPIPSLDPDRAWIAVAERDRHCDGLFVYAVKTTGIFCRPSCPSRRPRRENVDFYPDPETAEQAGFRACLRCKPAAIRSPAARLVERAVAWLDAAAEGSVSLDQLARAVESTPSKLRRAFGQLLGLSPADWATGRRWQRLAGLLSDDAGETDALGGPVTSVTDAIYAAGFGSGSRVYESAQASLGMSPETYRRGGTDMAIRWTVADSPLGRLLVAATAKGLCAVALGDDDETLLADLHRRFPKAHLAPADEGLAEMVAEVLRCCEGQLPSAELPLDLRGTAFQLKVWQELRRIPRGERRTYGELARHLGQPKAARAVARACATNPVALVVPCHRVVRGDGGLGGYRWGLERKQRLLEDEQD